MAPPAALRHRAFPLAIASGLVATSSLLADAVCSSQLLALAGPVILSVTYPLSGIAVGVAALVQFRSIDSRPRLQVLRTIGLTYAALYFVALVLVILKIVPIVSTTAVWLLSDQMDVLMPVMLWALAGDVFNAAEGKKVFGWMMGWDYALQILGLGLTIVAPVLLTRLDLPLPTLLLFNPVVCLVIAMWIPRRMRAMSVSQGTLSTEGTWQAVAGAGRFIRDVPVWKFVFLSTAIASTAVFTGILAFESTGEKLIGADAGLMQTYFALASLLILIGCLLFQWRGNDPLNRRVSIASQFAILPVAAIVGALLVALSDLTLSLVVLMIGMILMNIPFYTVDENIRHEALTLIPDQLRARVALVIDLGRDSVAMIVAGIVGLVGSLLNMLWVSGVIASAMAGVALVFAFGVRRHWENSMLNWRLRRRKRGYPAQLQWDDED